MINILVADDYPIVREGIVRIIENEYDMVVAGEAGSGNQVLEKVSQNKYDLLILDISMPDRDGLDIVPELKKINPKLPILILTMHPERNYALRMFKAGVSGYITKDRDPHELIEAIRAIVAGRKFVSNYFVEAINFRNMSEIDKPLVKALSNREFEIMLMIAKGKTVKEIAEELSISIKTVSTHRSRILIKLNIKSNAELIHYAFEQNLFD